MPPTQPHQPAPAMPSAAQGVLWAFVPFLTFGFGTPFAFLYAGVRRGSWRLGGTGVVYGGATAGVMSMFGTGEAGLIALGALLLTVLWIAGTVHAFAVRPSVFPRPTPHDRLNQRAVDVARHRRTLRAEARALIAEDPALAVELRIGRPDMPRNYDDGGLVDVNHVPGPTLALLPGMTDELVARVLRVRGEHGGFVSVEELAVDADLPPDLTQRIAEYAVFLR